MSLPTVNECFARLVEHLRKAQEEAAMIAHLRNESGRPHEIELAKMWLAVSELFKQMIHRVTMLATKGRLN